MSQRKKEAYVRKQYGGGDAYIEDLLEYAQEIEILRYIIRPLFRVEAIGRHEMVGVLYEFLLDHVAPITWVLKIPADVIAIARLGIQSLVDKKKASLFKMSCEELAEVVDNESQYINRIRKQLATGRSRLC